MLGGHLIGGRRGGVVETAGTLVDTAGTVVGALGRARRRPRRDVVVAELGQRLACRVVEHLRVTLGGDPRDRPQRTVADDRQHHIDQLGGHGVGVGGVQRCPDFGARVGPGGQLQVPSGVRAAGAPAQGDLVARQVMCGRVEIRRVQDLGRRLLDPGDRGDPFERGHHRGLDHVELALHLEMTRGLRRLCRHLRAPSEARRRRVGGAGRGRQHGGQGRMSTHSLPYRGDGVTAAEAAGESRCRLRAAARKRPAAGRSGRCCRRCWCTSARSAPGTATRIAGTAARPQSTSNAARHRRAFIRAPLPTL